MNLSAIDLGEALTALSDKLQEWLNGLVLMLPMKLCWLDSLIPTRVTGLSV